MNSKNGMYIVLLMKVVLIFALLATSANANPVNPANPRNLQSLHNSPWLIGFNMTSSYEIWGEKSADDDGQCSHTDSVRKDRY